MINPPFYPILESELPPIRTCQTQNQYWATRFDGNEQEIDQLLTMLADWPQKPFYRSLQHRLTDYVGSLNLLKFSFQRLRGDMLCQPMTCSSFLCQTCPETRFGMYPLIEAHDRPLTDEFSRVKYDCSRFLTGLMSLNLI